METFQIGLITSIAHVANMLDLRYPTHTDLARDVQSPKKRGRNFSVPGMLLVKTRTVLTRCGAEHRPRKSAANTLLPSQPSLAQN